MGGNIWWVDYIFYRFLRPFFQSPGRILRDYVKSGMTVLDVGCGTGYFSLGMARMVGPSGRVICVDLQAEAIESLKQKTDRAGLSERIDPRICSDNNLKIDDFEGQIDFALAFYVIHHATDIFKIMSQVQAALKPGGKFFIVEPGHHASADECKVTETAAQQAGFTIAGHPKLRRDWAVMLVNS